jgi:hypothetical protein
MINIFMSIRKETWEASRGQTSRTQISAALAGVSIENPGNSFEFLGPHTQRMSMGCLGKSPEIARGSTSARIETVCSQAYGGGSTCESVIGNESHKN